MENLLKLDILGHDDPTMIRMLEDLTGLSARDVPLDSKEVMSYLQVRMHWESNRRILEAASSDVWVYRSLVQILPCRCLLIRNRNIF